MKRNKPVAADKQWTLWPRIARPYACRSCGTEYDAALNDEVENTRSRNFMREATAEESAQWLGGLFGAGASLPGQCYTHDRYNAFLWCRTPGCSRFFDYDREAPGRMTLQAPSLTMRRKWLPMPPAANDRGHA